MQEVDRKTRYRELCKKEATIPIFCRDWWFDAVCGKNDWDVILVDKGQEIIGAMPYYLTRGLFGLPQIVMPKLTQHNGIWIRYQINQDNLRRISYEKEVMSSAIEQIERLNPAYFSQHFPYTTTNWLPFFWKGFQQTTRYTYVLEDLTDLDVVFNNFERDKRSLIKKASRSLKTGYDLSSQDFFQIHKQALAKQGLQINYSQEMLEEIYQAAYSRNQCKSIYCEDAQGNIQGCLFIVWDSIRTNFLISAYDPEHRHNGLGALLVWEAIKYAASHSQGCDFTGSIVESYERSYRAFGGKQKPYFNIRKTYSPLYMIHEGFHQLKEGVRLGARRIFNHKAHQGPALVPKNGGNPQAVDLYTRRSVMP